MLKILKCISTQKFLKTNMNKCLHMSSSEFNPIEQYNLQTIFKYEPLLFVKFSFSSLLLGLKYQ